MGLRNERDGLLDNEYRTVDHDDCCGYCNQKDHKMIDCIEYIDNNLPVDSRNYCLKIEYDHDSYDWLVSNVVKEIHNLESIWLFKLENYSSNFIYFTNNRRESIPVVGNRIKVCVRRSKDLHPRDMFECSVKELLIIDV